MEQLTLSKAPEKVTIGKGGVGIEELINKPTTIVGVGDLRLLDMRNDLNEKFGDAQNIQNKIRIGGLVLESSIKKEGEKTIFMITDRKKEVKVLFDGPLPDLFREGQGIVAEGMFQNNNFIASEVLAKHDENYMPPEVADALKKNNVWKGDSD